MTDSSLQQLERLLEDPAVRARLVSVLGDAGPVGSRWTRLRPFLAGFSSALVVMLAFLIPSVQEQWDQWRLRAAVDRYHSIGDQLVGDGDYAAAEQAFARAIELAGGTRLDLLEDQIRARTLRVYEDPAWRGNVSDDVTESDFAYLLATEQGPQRATTLAAYGAFLAGRGRLTAAEAALRDALRIAPDAPEAHVHLGNVFDDLGRSSDAEREYRTAIALNPDDAGASFNLGALLAESGRYAAALAPLARYVELEPGDPDGLRQLADALRASGDTAAAVPLEARARRLAARIPGTTCPPATE